jgi:regulator of RNase E activity RraA
MPDESRFGALSKRLRACYSGAVYDVMREMGLKPRVLSHDILPLEKSMVAAGPIYTIAGEARPGLSADETMLAWTEFLSRAPAEHVIVCQANDDGPRAFMGELSAETLKLRGAAGYIVDGGCRDTAFIERIDFPVFCRYFTPIDVVGAWVPVRFGEPVTIRGSAVHSGDWVLADRDGIVIIPGDHVGAVIERVEEVMRTESQVRAAIRKGVDPKAAYIQFGKF